MARETGPEILGALIRRRVEELAAKEGYRRKPPPEKKRRAGAHDERDYQVARAQLGGGGWTPIQDLMPGELPTVEAGQEDGLYQRQVAAIVRTRIKAVLPRQYYRVIVMRFGLNGSGDDGMTLQAIGDRIGVSRERVRQIQVSALAILQQDEDLWDLF